MKRYTIVFCGLIMLFGCSIQHKPKQDTLIKINNYEITRQEFEQEFKDSSFSRVDTIDSRREFLVNLINRKLILQDAQRKGVDKKEGFLKQIEKFWEQSLLRVALEKKNQEISGSAAVSDKLIKETYDKIVREGKTDKSYEQMYNQIRWELGKELESEMLNQWLADLRKKATIEIKDKQLQIIQ